MKIRGLIFDFDGLILDTETPDLNAWLDVYKKYKQAFDFNSYARSIGSIYDYKKPAEYLAQVVDNVSLEQVLDEWVVLEKKNLERQVLSPGVKEILKDARKLDLRISIASSAMQNWVVSHLNKHQIRDYFNTINTVDMVRYPKPDPALYHLALESINLNPDEVIAFEDSPNGIKAAKAAGIYCIAIPNQTTIHLNLNAADKVFYSLSEIKLADLIEQLQTL